MDQLGNFFVSAGEGAIALIFLALGAFIGWRVHGVHPRAVRWLAWFLLAGGVICIGFSLGIGLYFAILGAILQAICDSGKPSP